MKVGVAVGDIQAGLHAAVAILAAVHARTATGKGQWIDVSLLDCQAWGMINFASNYLNAGMVATRNGTAHPSVVP
ncbi:MAG: CoA transferase, partial [Alphaproteobacteria bacterium]|nr:CoA transferase [Alphaproteobacteria bacterium]